MVGAPKDFHWLFHLTVPLAAPHVSLLIHILTLYLSPNQIPGGTHPVSFHVLPYFGIHYLYPASLPRITCLNLNATSIVIFLLFYFLFSFPLSPFLALTLSGLLRPCDWQLPMGNFKVSLLLIASCVTQYRRYQELGLCDFGKQKYIVNSYFITLIHVLGGCMIIWEARKFYSNTKCCLQSLVRGKVDLPPWPPPLEKIYFEPLPKINHGCVTALARPPYF